MVRLTKQEREEFVSSAKSFKLKEDLRHLSDNRYNPFVINGDVNVDAFVKFLTEYSYFINHACKPFQKISDKIAKF
ncbi:MAG: hypothetical protein KAI03_04680 [Candidatus Aureabacteria bacterium]|nr:hypothetical protein [Candidatus Auribacterota bacterium]